MRFFASALLTVAVLHAQGVDKQTAVDKIFSAFNTRTPGCSVGVAVKGNVVLKAGYGMADLERNIPITPDTIFESGSVAKQFTAAALLLLAQQGKISLDDELRKYLPELQTYGKPVTIRQVLSHVSGLREWRAIGAFSGLPEGKFVYDNHDLLLLASRQKALNFEPGTAYSYTNTGFNVSTILLERALGDGRTFQYFTKEMIFAPLGMTHSQWRDDFRKIVPNRALAYSRTPQGWLQATPIENIIGAGGLLTTVGDLLLWNENFTHHKVGGAEMVKAQQTTATLKDGRKIIYAAGLQVSAFDGIDEVSHSGATGGYRTWLARYPTEGVSVAVMCNSAQANPTALGQETARLWTGDRRGPKAVDIPVSVAKGQSVAGMYLKVRDNTVSELRSQDGKLTFDRTELHQVAEGQFEAGPTKYVFEATGKLRVVTPTGDVLYERVEKAQPTVTELAAFAGKYSSDETASTLVVAVDAKGNLSYKIGVTEPVMLKPTFRDAFVTSSGSSIHFLRTNGKVTGLSAGEERVWDLRFKRVD